MQRPTDTPAEMVARAAAHLGPLEARIMEVAWRQGEVSVRDVRETLAGGRGLAYTTVMTVMARLATKGLLERALRGKTYRYRPALTARQFLEATARQRVEGLVSEFGEMAIAPFVEEMARSDPSRLEALRRLIAEKGGADG